MSEQSKSRMRAVNCVGQFVWSGLKTELLIRQTDAGHDGKLK